MVEKAYWLIQQIYLICFLGLCAAFLPKAAHSQEISLISDAETENYLAQVIKPLFKAAGVNFNSNNIFIVNDTSLNAFVSDGNYMFVNTGTLLNIDDTNELAGILAHETGHILGGHIVRQKLKMEKMQYAMLGSMLAAGAAAVSTGRGDAAMAVILGSQSSALNSMLNYQVEEERSADESAVKLLAKTKQSTAGLKRFMRKIKQQNALSGVEESDYFRTHPMTNERISHFNEAAKNNHFNAFSPLDAELAMIKAKFSAFMLDTAKVKRLYPAGKNDAPSRYAHAVLDFRLGNVAEALAEIDNLIALQPNNPYFYELKGQFLFESGQTAASISAYDKALKILPDSPLLKISMAQAVLENSPNKTQAQKAAALLLQSLVSRPSPTAWQLLARAYDISGKKAASYYAAAEFNYAIGNLEGADKQVKRAKKSQPDKSVLLKLDDLQERIKAELKERKVF